MVLALFVSLLAATVFEVANNGHLAAALIGGIGPDLALLLGAARGLEKGQLDPRAVPVYNAVHRIEPPLALTLVAATGLLGTGWFILGLAWTTHVVMDRAAGYGLRTSAGFQRA
jgi:hypothetical protein